MSFCYVMITTWMAGVEPRPSGPENSLADNELGSTSAVITGLDPVIHGCCDTNIRRDGRVDGRIKSGHDDQ